MRARQPALDGLRGLAVLLVFCFHYAGGASSSNPVLRTLGEINKAGWAGVTLFFVLSGFLITGILWDSLHDPHWARKFYVRRALRILPLYYAALALTLVAAAIAGTLQPALHSIWIPALFLQNMPGLSQQVQELRSPLLLHHLWTLAVEEQFYLLWPLLLVRQKSARNASGLCIGVFAFSIAFRIAVSAPGLQIAEATGMLFARAGELAVGGWLAIAYRSTHWESVRRWASLACVGASLIFVGTSFAHGSAELGGALQIVVGLSAASVALGALLVMTLSPGGLQRAMGVAWLRGLGTISYGVYVFHILLRPLFWKVTHELVPVSGGAAYFATRFVVAAVATVLVSWLSYRFYESLFLRLKKAHAYVSVDVHS